MTKKPKSAGRSASEREKPDTPPPTRKIDRVLNCLPSKKTENDWTIANLGDDAVSLATPLPKKVDLRADWWGIGDQKDTGSCVGWAAADAVLRWHFVETGRIGRNERLSPRYIWMASKEMDDDLSYPTSFIELSGTYLKSALDVARKYGCVLEDVLPFAGDKLYPGEVKDFYALASNLKIAKYVNLGTNPTTWRTWIARQGPVLTRLVCDATWMDASATGGVLAEYDPKTAYGGHAVALVGYDETGFIVRNSWGIDTWGDKGFGYASRAYAQAAFTEAYGVGL